MLHRRDFIWVVFHISPKGGKYTKYLFSIVEKSRKNKNAK